MRRIKDQRGFTLVEIAIVLVIIGIILGGVLKGQELIKNAKYKNVYNQYRQLVAAMYTYYDKYQRFPGDDNRANPRWAAVPAGDNGNANGIIDPAAAVLWCAASDVGENCALWQELRLAGVINGATTAVDGRVAPTNAFGGSVAIIRGTSSGVTTAAAWIIPFAICFQGLPDGAARWLELNYDDGVVGTGSIRGQADYMPESNDDIATSTQVCIAGT